MKEIEFKYSAKNIKLEDFYEFCKKRNPIDYNESHGVDYFYVHPDYPDRFYRHRRSNDLNQLTFKQKRTEDNNYIRIESDVDLAKHMTIDKIRAHVETQGYQPGKYIFKNCFYYVYDYYILVYYVCYDPDLNELGRFFEIEIKEGYPWPDEESAWSSLLVVEKLCKSLGVGPDNRIKNSLFEMYGR